MIAFQRLSAGPTIPDLIRQVADRQAYQSLQILPKEVWCRRAAIAIVWHHRNNIIQHPSAQAGAAQRKPLPAHSMHKFVGQRMDPSLAPHCSLQASSRAIVRSQRVMMQVSPAAETIHSWSNRQLAKVFLTTASGILAIAQARTWYRRLTPQGIGSVLIWSDRLTRVGMLIWHSSRRPFF